MKAHGTVIKYGDNVDTDVIIPARYLNSSDVKELAAHCMEDIDKTFVKRVKPGDIMVGLENFGCGSSREHAPLVIRESGISCVVAASFARIFYRNAINIGLPIIESPDAARELSEGDRAEIDFENGKLINLTNGKQYDIAPLPPFIQSILSSGGLIEAVKSGRLEGRNDV